MSVKATARNRESESRRLEERISELRNLNTNDISYRDPLHIPPELIPYGWEYHWARESTYDIPDPARIIELRKKGWTPVPADRHPHMVFEDFLGRKEYLRGYIAHKGLVLVERPKVIGDKARAELEAYNNRVETSMPGTDKFKSQHGITTSYIQNPAVTHEVGIEQGW